MKFMRKIFAFFLTAVILSSVIFSAYAAMPDWADEYVNEFGTKLTENEKSALYSRLWFSNATLDEKMPILEKYIPNINHNYIQYEYENRKDIESTTFELLNYNWEENTVNFEYMITNSYNDFGHEGIYIMIIERGTDRVWRVERIDKYGSSSDLYKKVNENGTEKLVAADWTEVRPDDPYITPPSESFTKPYVVARYHRVSIEIPYYFDSEYYGVYIVPVYYRDTYSGGSYFGYYFEDAIELTRTSISPVIPDPTPGCSIKYYRDSNKMFEVTDLVTVNPQLCTYYSIVCDDGYVCRSLEVMADYADAVNISDCSAMLKSIAE